MGQSHIYNTKWEQITSVRKELMCVIAASEDEEDFICGVVSDTKNSRSNNKIQSLKEESLGLEYIFNSRLLH